MVAAQTRWPQPRASSLTPQASSAPPASPMAAAAPAPCACATVRPLTPSRRKARELARERVHDGPGMESSKAQTSKSLRSILRLADEGWAWLDAAAALLA